MTVSRVEDHARIEIRDNGSGIPESISRNLFRKGATYGKEAGSGLGLFQARKSVEGWGGRIGLESKEGVGTTVDIILPLYRSQISSDIDAVVIDDEELVRASWRMAARRAGKKVVACRGASDVKGIIDKLPKGLPVYCDYGLGGGANGIDVADELFNRYGFKKIFIMTGADPGSLRIPEWISGVLGKDPPWGTV